MNSDLSALSHEGLLLLAYSAARDASELPYQEFLDLLSARMAQVSEQTTAAGLSPENSRAALKLYADVADGAKKAGKRQTSFPEIFPKCVAHIASTVTPPPVTQPVDLSKAPVLATPPSTVYPPAGPVPWAQPAAGAAPAVPTTPAAPAAPETPAVPAAPVVVPPADTEAPFLVQPATGDTELITKMSVAVDAQPNVSKEGKPKKARASRKKAKVVTFSVGENVIVSLESRGGEQPGVVIATDEDSVEAQLHNGEIRRGLPLSSVRAATTKDRLPPPIEPADDAIRLICHLSAEQAKRWESLLSGDVLAEVSVGDDASETITLPVDDKYDCDIVMVRDESAAYMLVSVADKATGEYAQSVVRHSTEGWLYVTSPKPILVNFLQESVTDDQSTNTGG